MSINTETAQRCDITIAGIALSVPQPFSEGHVLRENEASVLNQTYAENIRNNFASTVKKAKEEAAANNAPLDPATLQAGLDEYLVSYDFGVRRVGTRAVSMDPVQREALRMAEEAVKAALHKRGTSIKEVGKERFAELAAQVLEKNPQLLERAKQIVDIKSSIPGDISV